MGVCVIPYERTKVNWRPPRTNPIQCKNCGAPLHGNKCEYCDSVYEPPTFEELEELQARVCDDIGNVPFLY